MRDASGPGQTLPPLEAAAYWRVRHDAGTMTRAEQDGFDTWLGESAAHESAWSQAGRAWDLFEVPDDPHLSAMRSAALMETARPARWPSLRLAAGLAAVGVSAVLALTAVPRGPEAPRTAGGTATATSAANTPTRYRTKRGERLSVTLADGSGVTLDTDTVLEVAFRPDRRGLRLIRGRALFDVAKDARRPFVVAAGGQEVTALGTVFDVAVDTAKLEVLLVEGRVTVRPPPSPRSAAAAIVLRPGEELTASRGEPARVAPVDTEAALLWRTGLIELNDVTLVEAVAELNRYSLHPLTLRDPEVGALRVSGVFRTGTPERFVETIAEVLPVVAHRTPAGLEIARRTGR